MSCLTVSRFNLGFLIKRGKLVNNRFMLFIATVADGRLEPSSRGLNPSVWRQGTRLDYKSKRKTPANALSQCLYYVKFHWC